MENLPYTVTVYKHGIEVPGVSIKSTTGGNVGKRKAVQGWSKASRRRLRQLLLRFGRPDLPMYGVCLTIPGDVLSKGEQAPIFNRFKMVLNRSSVPAVWRLELQKRGQPHWHLIAWSARPDFASWVNSIWLRSLRDRGKLQGAARYAVEVSIIDSMPGGALRYLFDHASKQNHQIAVGWGRHWGVINQSLLQQYPSETFKLSERQKIILWRLLRRAVRRRIPDRRAAGGVNWSNVTRETSGFRVVWMGGGFTVSNWDGVGLPSLDQQRKACRAMGASKNNPWALRLSKYKRGFFGQHFGISSKMIHAAIEISGYSSG